MLHWIGLYAALAQAPDPGALGFRVNDEAGWTLQGDQLQGPRGRTLHLQHEPSPGEITMLTLDDIARERAELVVGMAERKLIAKEVDGRVVTTPTGEPGVLLIYTLSKGKGYEGEVPPRGIRVTRRCGATVRITDEGEAPDQALVLEAAAQLLWADPECERYNLRPYRRVETEVAAAPPPPARVVEEEPEDKGSGLAVILGVATVLVVGTGLALRSVSASRGPRPAQQGAKPAGGGGERPGGPPPKPGSAAPRPVLLSPEPAYEGPSSVAEQPAQTQRKPAEPRPLGALGAQEGVWVTPAVPARPEDPVVVAVKRLGQAVGLDRSPQRAPELASVPPGYLALLENFDGVSFGGGWLRLLGCWEGRGLTVQELNRALQGRVGRRFILGFFGNGTLVMLSSRGELQVAAPGDRIPTTLSSNLTSFLDLLCDDREQREALCDPAALQAAQRQVGSLGPDQVLRAGETPERQSVVAVWEHASSLL